MNYNNRNILRRTCRRILFYNYCKDGCHSFCELVLLGAILRQLVYSFSLKNKIYDKKEDPINYYFRREKLEQRQVR